MYKYRILPYNRNLIGYSHDFTFNLPNTGRGTGGFEHFAHVSILHSIEGQYFEIWRC